MLINACTSSLSLAYASKKYFDVFYRFFDQLNDIKCIFTGYF